MTFYFLTLFPEMITAYFHESIMKRAIEQDIFDVKVIDIRDFAQNKHNRVDDYPYGGGAGMVMQAPPVIRAVESILEHDELPVIFLTPGGKPFEAKDAHGLAKTMDDVGGLIFLCGHYEGIDERAIARCVTMPYSIGDYVLTGGELPALCMADAIARQLPGVLGNNDSLSEESFEHNLLEYPQYTRPEEVDGMRVPDVLLSGHHANIAKWRHEQAVKRTQERRPDLYEKYLKEQAEKK